MSKSNNEGTKKVLETQQQQHQHEFESDNEDSEAITEQSNEMSESSTAAAARRKRRESKYLNNKRSKSQQRTNLSMSTSNATATTTKPQNSESTTTTSTTIPTSTSIHINPLPPLPATQFSVQRSDTDGLRMRISAIRPSNSPAAATQHIIDKKETTTTTITSITTTTTTTAASTINSSSKRKSTLAISTIVGDRANNNTLKVKISNKLNTKTLQHQQQQQHQQQSISKQTFVNMGESPTKLESSSMSNTAIQTNPNSNTNSNSNTNNTSPMTIGGFGECTTYVSSTGLPLMSTILSQAAPCLSDATESGCSEATTTTIAAAHGNEKAAKRVKLKKKKAQSKNSETKRSLKKSRHSKLSVFSSDTDEDDIAIGNIKDGRHKPVAQRAPRLLLKAIHSKDSLPQIKSLHSPLSSAALTMVPTTAGGGTGVGSDNIGLSSSDIELPDLVNAAIKCVESDTDDTTQAPSGIGSFRRSKTRNVQQYQSTLLQDFMVKTQMLGQEATTSTSTSTTTSKGLTQQLADTAFSADATKTTESAGIGIRSGAAAGAGAGGSGSGDVISEIISKKRRGRPKKGVSASESLLDVHHHQHSKPSSSTATSTAANINESGDSGVISTTSTTQSTSPSPKLLLTVATATANAMESNTRQPYRHSKPRKHGDVAADVLKPTVASSGENLMATAKPKIDIAYLDKRMYAATERVLYPPPRNKRRQSMSALILGSKSNNAGAVTTQQQQLERKSAIITQTGVGATTTTAGTPTSSNRVTKEELQLDPVWRKIDVNKKFRRPSLSGYKSDGGGGNTTICSKILAAKSGYVSDYGSSFIVRSSHHHHNHNSGYKSDASCKSRYSVKSCVSRRSRAKSCGYRSDCKESVHGGGHAGSMKSSKFRRKRRCSTLFMRGATSKAIGSGNPNEDQDILQLAGLSLGQSSEESNEYVCKPNLDSLPSTSVSKKYGEINRFIATGEYFGRGNSGNSSSGNPSSFAGLTAKRLYELTNDDISQDGFGVSSAGGMHATAHGLSSLGSSGIGIGNKLQIPRKNSLPVDELTTQDLLPHTSRKIKSRRSSAASYCSSYVSGISKIRRRRRRKSFRHPSAAVDSKLLTEIDILTSTFGAMCRIQSLGSASGSTGVGAANEKERVHSNIGSSDYTNSKIQQTAAATGSGAGGKREIRDKRSTKKRKISENLDFALLSAAAAGVVGGLTPSSGGGSSKRRHKKMNNSSPDDHKLPLKKRHYLLTPGEKSAATEAAAVAAKLFANSTEAWAAAAAVAKSTASTKSQQQFSASGGTASTSVIGISSNVSANSKGGKTGLTPKKRHLLQNSGEDISMSSTGVGGLSLIKGSNSSPLRIVVDGIGNSISGGKLLDISPLSLSAGSSTKHSASAAGSSVASTDVVHKKRSRLEGLVTKIATASHTDEKSKDTISSKTSHKSSSSSSNSNSNSNSGTTSTSTSTSAPQLDSETSCPPPGVFEPSVELEIQIPPITKLTEAAASIITKSEVDSPLLMDINKSYSSTAATTKTEGTRVVETLLNKTGANLILKRKRKKFNRTGFPTVRRKKRKIHEQLLLDVTPDISEKVQKVMTKSVVSSRAAAAATAKDRKLNSSSTVTIAAATTTTTTATAAEVAEKSTAAVNESCDRVPQAGEASDNFLQRANRTPRLSVVALERLQGTPTKTTAATGTLSTATVETAEADSSIPTTASKSTTPVRPPSSRSNSKNAITNKKQKKAETSAMQEETKIISTPRVIKPTKKIQELAKSNNKDKIITSTTGTGTATATVTPTPRVRGRKSKLAVTTSIASAPTQAVTELNHKDSKSKSSNVEAQTKAQKRSTSSTSVITKVPSLSGKSESTAFTKSSVQKIITAKSLEAKVKLPAGVDPNTIFNCKIRLKRRNALFSQYATPKALNGPSSNANSSGSQPPSTNNNSSSGFNAPIPPIPKISEFQLRPHNEPDPPAAEIDAEAALKDPDMQAIEHDVLPMNECSFNFMESLDAHTCDTGDEKSSSSGGSRKISAPVKKNYLPAGLFSDYFKLARCPALEPLQKPTAAQPHKKNGDISKDEGEGGTLSLLPPPHYCERYFRRTQRDFQLPYDIYWAYTHGKLPKRNTVPSWQYRKIRTNIYAESVRPNMAGFDHPICNCKFDAGCGENCLNRMVYTECSPSSCPTRDRCSNQKIQRHEVAPGVERFMTTDKGWGIRTKMSIHKGTYILEYVGEVVTEREFKDRMGLIYQNDTHHYCLHLDGGLVIDGHRMGSDGRFVNHSCMPNCEMQKWSVNGLSRMALFAARNIEPGEELTYDYNFSLFNPSEGQPCRCNTPQCRGVIGGKSQRVKPLPPEVKVINEPANAKETGRNGRQRKRKAKKNTQRLQSKDIAVARVQQLSEKEKKLVKQYGIFLVRSFEKIRRCRARKHAKQNEIKSPKPVSPSPTPASGSLGSTVGANSHATTPATITNRRPSTPTSLAAQISALCSQRNIKTRGLTLAVQDPEVEKMAKIAVILRDICAALEALKSVDDDKQCLVNIALAANSSSVPTTASVIENTEVITTSTAASTAAATTTNTTKKKKAIKLSKSPTATLVATCLSDFKTLQSNIEQGYYKQPTEFEADMQKIFVEARNAHAGSENASKTAALDRLIEAYESEKFSHYDQLLELLGDEAALVQFRATPSKAVAAQNLEPTAVVEKASPSDHDTATLSSAATELNALPTEDIIRCICGLYKDEGLMIQCARCMVWQHTECTKADVNADNYHCERCEPRTVDREIPLEDFTEDGHRYYLSLMRGELHVRQGDAVYVLRDIPIKDEAGNVVPAKKHTYETIGHIDYNECDIFRVERLWKNNEGKRFIFGHHFLRPHETFHEPTRRFYPNEVVRVPLYEVVPIELVIGRCWVLDRTTFCKGRPIECTDDDHCYICELRVDKSARFFSKAKINYPTCTKTYAFRKFPERLKISKTYAPHDVNPAMLKSKKQKTEMELNAGMNLSACGTTNNASNALSSIKKERSFSQQTNARKRQNSASPAIGVLMHLITPPPPTVQTIKQRRTHLENVLKNLKLKCKNTKIQVGNGNGNNADPPIDLSYLLSGRGARQRKTLYNTAPASPHPFVGAAANNNSNSPQ